MKQTTFDTHLFHCEFYSLKAGWVVYQNVWTADKLIAKNYRLQGWQASNGIRIASKNSPAWVGNTLYLEGGFPNFARKPVLIELPEGTAYSDWLHPIQQAVQDLCDLDKRGGLTWAPLPYDEGDHD